MTEIQHKWDVTLTHRITREKVRTFTWAPTRGQAIARMRTQMAEQADTWKGYSYRVATLPTTVQYTPEQVRAARAWLMDCEWGDLEAEEIESLSPLTVVRGVQRHYEGGWFAFVEDNA